MFLFRRSSGIVCTYLVLLLVQAAAGVVCGLDLVCPRRDGRAEGERDRARRARRPGAQVHCKIVFAVTQ